MKPIKKPKKKCPVCSSSKFHTNPMGDSICRNCGYSHLSPETLKQREEGDFKTYDN